MSAAPVIGLATQTLEAIPGRLPPCWVMGQRYVRVLTSVGALPWLIPLLRGDEATLRAIYDRLDGLLLAGGVDIDPSAYDEPRHELCDRSDLDRDWVELTLIRWALADHKPLLGVCRGAQAINVACGGSLYQHVADERPDSIKHDFFPVATGHPRDYLAHTVRATAGSYLGRVLGTGPVSVNSMHHQGIKRLAPGLSATVFAPDGLVEGVERNDGGGFLVGVQWHPEELAEAHAPMRHLFTDLIEAARAARR